MPASKKASTKSTAKSTSGSAAKSGSKATAAKRKSASATDAIALLTHDHDEVSKLFKAYDKLAEAEAEDDERQALAEQICGLLTVHATVEEEIFYPAARDALEEQDLLDEAEVEHASAKDLIAQLQAMSPGDDLYDAKVKVLGEYVEHHVTEEEDEMFPKAKKAGLDLEALGAEISARKEALMEEMGLAEEQEEEEEA